MKKKSLTMMAGASLAAVALAIAPLAPAQAADPGVWGVWDAIPLLTANDHANTIKFGNALVPDATFDITGSQSPTGVEVLNVTDEDEWFTSETPIGAVFGANGPSATNNFLKITSSDGTSTDNILTVTFAAPTKAGNLGFAVSDLDTDHVTVSALDASGGAVSGADLLGSANSTAAFNFCNVTDPPGGCSDTDVPTVSTNADNVVATGGQSSSDGSTVWFQPSVAVSSVTFTYRNDDTNAPSSTRYWFAQLPVALPNTGVSASSMLGMFGFGAALLAAGALIVVRRRRA